MPAPETVEESIARYNIESLLESHPEVQPGQGVELLRIYKACLARKIRNLPTVDAWSTGTGGIEAANAIDPYYAD